jgi:hypothetical protein
MMGDDGLIFGSHETVCIKSKGNVTLKFSSLDPTMVWKLSALGTPFY